MSGYGVDPEALRAAEVGITASIAELRKAGFHGEERSGVTVVAWKLDLDDSGHQVITDGLDEFLDRLHYWVRGLIAGTEELVNGLADTRSTYQKVEDEVMRALRWLGKNEVGNPMEQTGFTPGGPQ